MTEGRERGSKDGWRGKGRPDEGLKKGRHSVSCIRMFDFRDTQLRRPLHSFIYRQPAAAAGGGSAANMGNGACGTHKEEGTRKKHLSHHGDVAARYLLLARSPAQAVDPRRARAAPPV